jgi:hypothetical protein
MFACPSGNVFIGSIDTIGEQKDAHYICNVLVGYIETIRINNIVQIYIDNASTMKSEVDFLIYHFPSLYFQGCVTHFLDLLLEYQNNMNEVNCEKGENYYLFHTITPYAISNILSL